MDPDRDPDTSQAQTDQCPECEIGVVVSDGPMEWETGHSPLRCSERCGWTN